MLAEHRPGPTLVVRENSRLFSKWVQTYLGSNFEYTVRPSVPIVGTVRDTDAGKPLAGITIQGYKVSGTDVPNYVASHYFKTTTDHQGRTACPACLLAKTMS